MAPPEVLEKPDESALPASFFAVPEVEENLEEVVAAVVGRDQSGKEIRTTLRRVQVTAEVQDFLAKIDVAMTFYNNTDKALEAT